MQTQPPSPEVLDDLLEDNTMEAARYDLSEEAERLNVIFISMDALRFDTTGVGGNSAGVTPNLDAFAEEAVIFHDATAAAPGPCPRTCRCGPGDGPPSTKSPINWRHSPAARWWRRRCPQVSRPTQTS